MFRLFFKTGYVLTLWVLLFANLIFVFNIDSIPLVSMARDNFDGYYFGFSTLLNGFTDLTTGGYFDWLSHIQSSINQLKNTAVDLLTGDQTIFGGIEIPEINNPLDVLTGIWIGLIAILKAIGSLFVFIAVLLFFAVYVVCILLSFTYFIFALFAGYYVTPLPVVPTPTF